MEGLRGWVDGDSVHLPAEGLERSDELLLAVDHLLADVDLVELGVFELWVRLGGLP